MRVLQIDSAISTAERLGIKGASRLLWRLTTRPAVPGPCHERLQAVLQFRDRDAGHRRVLAPSCAVSAEDEGVDT